MYQKVPALDSIWVAHHDPEFVVKITGYSVVGETLIVVLFERIDGESVTNNYVPAVGWDGQFGIYSHTQTGYDFDYDLYGGYNSNEHEGSGGPF